VIDVRGVTVRFGARAALRGASLHAGRGELVGIVGPAAAGKTVLLKTICLLHRPDEGELVVDGIDLIHASPAETARLRSRVGFAFQNLALFDRLDAVENVAFVLKRRGIAPEEARERAAEQLRQVGLAAALEKLPHELSGGMKRRLALARALVSRPEIALFDDPFVGLDPVACARIARLVATSHRTMGGVTLVAAGDPAPLLDVADRVVLMSDGAIEADLPARDFADAAGAVARFLGRTEACA